MLFMLLSLTQDSGFSSKFGIIPTKSGWLDSLILRQTDYHYYFVTNNFIVVTINANKFALTFFASKQVEIRIKNARAN